MPFLPVFKFAISTGPFGLFALGLLVFLTFAVTFKKPFCMKNFCIGPFGLFNFVVTFKKPFCIKKTFASGLLLLLTSLQ